TGSTGKLYKLSAYVTSPRGILPETPLKFKIYLYGTNGSNESLGQPIKVSLLTDWYTVEVGDSFKIPKERQAQVSENSYDKICIEFEVPPPFFNGKNMVCNKITCNSNVTSSEYTEVPVIPYGYNIPPARSGSESTGNASAVPVGWGSI
ncbi:MAG TPA: hypothetical protein VK158_01460, partial [Acidobacteriota bacterium]|nr:hypothetical protein [Acidobacteriota bacterium]